MKRREKKPLPMVCLGGVVVAMMFVLPLRAQWKLPKLNTSPGPEYSSKSRLWQGIPGIERAPNGRLWATWYSGGKREPSEHNYVLLVTSGDDGKSWSGPKIVVDPPGPARAYDPMLWHDPQGRLWFVWAQNAGPPGPYAIHTENSGSKNPTWSPVRRLYPPDEDYESREKSPPIHADLVLNKPLVLESGVWLLPLRRSIPEVRMGVLLSSDRGKSWKRYGDISVPGPSQGEPMVVARADGSLWMLIRATGGRIWESVSRDNGRTWSESGPTKIVNPRVRFFLGRLASGRLLLINTHHENARVTMQASLSEDDGRTWTFRPLMLDERASVSYPDAVQAPDGTIYAVHDRERHGAKEILLSVFTEADVMGSPSGTARFKQIINKVESGSESGRQ